MSTESLRDCDTNAPTDPPSCCNSLETSTEHRLLVKDGISVQLYTYSSNLEKNYEYNCGDVPSFTNNLCSVLTSNELQLDDGSVGQFIHQARRDSVLTDK